MPEIAYGKPPLSTATLNLGNADDYFSDLHNTHGHLREIPVSIWRAHFNASTGALYDKLLVFKGETRAMDSQDICSFSLGPTSDSRLIPGRRIDTRNFPYLSKQDTTFSWADAQIELSSIGSHPARTGYFAEPQKPYEPPKDYTGSI